MRKIIILIGRLHSPPDNKQLCAVRFSAPAAEAPPGGENPQEKSAAAAAAATRVTCKLAELRTEKCRPLGQLNVLANSVSTLVDVVVGKQRRDDNSSVVRG